MTWLQRLRENITLTSPNGTAFEAKWRGNPRTITNTIGTFKYPGVPGARVQDLRVSADLYELTLYFDGNDNDTNADGFMTELKNSVGNWEIMHPVKGPLFLTLVSARENILPIESGGLTVVESSWIEPLPESAAEAAAQAQARAEAQAAQANATAAQQYSGIAGQGSAGQRQSIIGTISKVITTAKTNLALIRGAEIIDPRLLAIETAISNTLSGSDFDLEALAGQVQAYTQLHVLGQEIASDSVTMFSNYANELLNIKPDQATDDGLSQIATTELAVSAAMVAAGQSALIGGITSRGQALSTLESVSGMMTAITEGLDNAQELYKDLTIDKQYFSQSSSYADTLLMSALSNRFLMLSTYGLQAERRVILKQNLSTPQIAKNEYGQIGNADSEIFYLEKLIESNSLMGDEIYLLKAGREILIYQ